MGYFFDLYQNQDTPAHPTILHFITFCWSMRALRAFPIIHLSACPREREGEGKRERESETERQRDMKRDIERERGRDGEREREREDTRVGSFCAERAELACGSKG